MKTAVYARILLGASAIVLGVVEVLRPDSDLRQNLHPLGPLTSIIVWCLAVLLVAGGAGIMFARTERLASIVLGAAVLVLSLANVPGMIGAPADYAQYINFFELFSVVCGAAAVYALTETNPERSAAIGRIVRFAFGICTIKFALDQVVYLQYTSSLVPTWIPPSQTFWTILTTIAFVLAGIAVLVNVQARLALNLMTVMLALFGLLVWVPRIVAQPQTISNWNEISSNYLMTAAAWMVAVLASTPAVVRATRRRLTPPSPTTGA